jgi:hypothetical protein
MILLELVTKQFRRQGSGQMKTLSESMLPKRAPLTSLLIQLMTIQLKSIYQAFRPVKVII